MGVPANTGVDIKLARIKSRSMVHLRSVRMASRLLGTVRVQSIPYCER